MKRNLKATIWLGLLSLGLMSCGILDVEPCEPGREVWKPVDGSWTTGTTEWMYLAADPTTTDSILVEKGNGLYSGYLRWKNRCSYVELHDSVDLVNPRNWLITALYMNFNSNDDCEGLPFDNAGGLVTTSDTAIVVSWGTAQCEDVSSSSDDDDDDDDLWDD